MNLIEKYIEEENWQKARSEIHKRLKTDKDHHWLITRLGLTYYEERKYQKSLEYAEKAIVLAPDCPLVLWDYAGTLDMLGRKREAIKVYQKIIKKGINEIAFGKCGEGIRWAKSIFADSLYRLALINSYQGHKRKAIEYFELHFSSRGKGIPSIYKLNDVKKDYKKLVNGL